MFSLVSFAMVVNLSHVFRMKPILNSLSIRHNSLFRQTIVSIRLVLMTTMSFNQGNGTCVLCLFTSWV